MAQFKEMSETNVIEFLIRETKIENRTTVPPDNSTRSMKFRNSEEAKLGLGGEVKDWYGISKKRQSLSLLVVVMGGRWSMSRDGGRLW
ncbi:unnamed protein product [Dovyalis caffra]|uniref:Uncharacterized protein n=1 Tax=Dovyalis caffra TaxID=77055 RepID=A0AAV1R1S4_9ROSI|nr:unnamed protein product [Dovyalis caffra]